MTINYQAKALSDFNKMSENCPIQEPNLGTAVNAEATVLSSQKKSLSLIFEEMSI